MLALLLLCAIPALLAESWPQDMPIVDVECTGSGFSFACTPNWNTDLQPIFDEFYGNLTTLGSYVPTSSPSSLVGYDLYNEAMSFFGSPDVSLSEFMSVSYFFDYYANNTLGVLEGKDYNVFGYADGIYFSKAEGTDASTTQFIDEDMMMALRNMAVLYNVTFTGSAAPSPLFVAGYLFSFAFNFVFIGGDDGFAFTHNIDVAWATLEDSTLEDFYDFWADRGLSSSLPASLFTYNFLANGDFSVAAFEDMFSSVYLLEPVTDNEPVTGVDAYGRSNCTSVRETDCATFGVPAYFFSLGELESSRPNMYYTKYGVSKDVSCQFRPETDMSGMPKSVEVEDRTEVQYLIQDGSDFFRLKTAGSVWNATSLCDTSTPEIYGLYDSYWYTAVAGMFGSYSQKDYNLDNMYSSVRVWPTRNNNTVFVIAIESDKAEDDAFFKAQLQKCSNVYSDSKGEEVAGCLDDASMWDWGVFAGSIVGIVVIAALWVWGTLGANEFDANLPSYYRPLEKLGMKRAAVDRKAKEAKMAQKRAKYGLAPAPAAASESSD
eukprot:gnl/Chilomastix_cuspidata/33.p1 GENE.gnl/Chilomastix_cuspidata/33~~gnl/Chilomastix_cuspidata/33.p1  ORF type:complete len:546 (+),score=257.35 gnl/Chilomastix_cuspidata/33:49-1686(+)